MASSRRPRTSAVPPIPEPIPIAPPLPTPQERRAMGKSLRKTLPRKAHAIWQPAAHRFDPIELLENSSKSRLPNLIPIRYGRMLASPFSYLRGSPIVMAADLAQTHVTGIQVQLCGDAHLLNFGLYASPERNLLFDLNDFDETLPGPWEWDIKRLAASCVVAGRTNHFSPQDCLAAGIAAARSYRERLRKYSRMSLLGIWYSRVDAGEALRVIRRGTPKTIEQQLSQAVHRTSLQAISKLATATTGQLRIVDNPPLVTHISDPSLSVMIRRFLTGYKASLQEDRRTLFDRYRFADFALKVVGVGSVGTRCYLVLLDGSHAEDPLFLQIKEAQASVLEPHVLASKSPNHGHRVVCGQRLMQSASDIFLGWYTEGQHHYYVRQLRDMKGGADLNRMSSDDLIGYAELCGWVLARAHARSGDPAAITGYLGKSDVFDEAIGAFAMAYADQNELDYAAFQAAVKSGRLTAEPGV